MTFTVTYRGEDGALREERVEAAGRAECFAQMKARGIAPLSVKEGNHISRRERRGRREEWGKNGCAAASAKATAAKERAGGRVVACVLSVALVALIVGGVWWWLGLGEALPSKEPEAPKKAALAKEVTPAAAPKPVAETAPTNAPQQAAAKPDPKARPTRVGEVVNGYVKLPSGRLHRQLGVVTNSIANRPKGRHEIFRHDCDNEIAACLTLRPGDPVIGIPPYNGRFRNDFLKSLEEPIVVSEDDSPEDAQLKRDVIAARIELKDAMDRGEDIEKIMLDSRRELQKLMQIKMDYKRLFASELKNCGTDKEVEDLFNACNKVLEEQGIAPLKYGPITRRNLLRAREKKEPDNRKETET